MKLLTTATAALSALSLLIGAWAAQAEKERTAGPTASAPGPVAILM
jgi:hypothetical protein